MITVPAGAGVRIYLAMGRTDMRKGFDGLSVLAQEALKQDPFSGSFFIFRGKRGDLVKVLYWDGQGFCQLLDHVGVKLASKAGVQSCTLRAQARAQPRRPRSFASQEARVKHSTGNARPACWHGWGSCGCRGHRRCGRSEGPESP